MLIDSSSFREGIYGTGTSRQRHDHSRGPSGNTAIESYNRGAFREARRQPEDGDEVARARQRR